MEVRAGRVADGGKDSKVFGVREGFMVTGAGGRRNLVKGILEAASGVVTVRVVGEVAGEEDIVFIELFSGGGRGGRLVERRRVGVDAEESVG